MSQSDVQAGMFITFNCEHCDCGMPIDPFSSAMGYSACDPCLEQWAIELGREKK